MAARYRRRTTSNSDADNSKQVQGFGIRDLKDRGHRKSGDEDDAPQRRALACELAEEFVNHQCRAHTSQHRYEGEGGQGSHPGGCSETPGQEGKERIERPGIFLDHAIRVHG